MDQRQGKDQQRAGDAERVELAADLRGVTVNGRREGVVQGGYGEDEQCKQGDAGQRDRDLDQRWTAARSSRGARARPLLVLESPRRRRRFGKMLLPAR